MSRKEDKRAKDKTNEQKRRQMSRRQAKQVEDRTNRRQDK